MQTLEHKTKWVFNKRDDLLWLIVPALIGFLIIGLYYIMTGQMALSEETTVIILYLSWAMLFDGTHAFATYTRTYFDKEFYHENKAMLWKSLLVFLVGPIFVMGGYFLDNNINYASTSFIVFNRFAICYAYYHLIRQHWGFIIIYRKKNNEPDDITRTLDGWLLALGTIFPFVHGQIYDIKLIHIAETLTFTKSDWLMQALFMAIGAVVLFVLSYIRFLKLNDFGARVIAGILLAAAVTIYAIQTWTLTALLNWASLLCAIGFVGVMGYYVYLTVSGSYKPEKNLPKWILFFTVVVSYNIAFHLDIPILILIAAITVFHNVQYHKIVNFHNVNKYKPEEKEKYGFAVVLAQKFGLFVVFALLFNLFSYVPRFSSNVLISNLLLNYLLSAFFWGVAFHHYYLDSVIWRFKGNQQLNKDIKINQ